MDRRGKPHRSTICSIVERLDRPAKSALVDSHRHEAGANDFSNVEWSERLDEPFDVGNLGTDFYDDGLSGRLGRLGQEFQHDLIHGVSLFVLRLDPDQGKLAANADIRLEIFTLDNVDELVELLQALSELHVVAVDHESESAEAGVLAVSCVKAGERESASAEKRCQSVDGSGLVLDQSGDCVLMGRRICAH